MLKILRLAVGLAALSMLGACAFTRDEVAVNYAYKGPAPAALTAEQRKLISSAEVTDRRGSEDPRLIINKFNAYGPTEGSWVAEKPIVDIVRGALLDGFRAAGIRTDGGPGQPTLRTQVLELRPEVLRGFWTGTLNMRLQLRVELVDPSSGRVLWNDTFFGQSSRSGLVILEDKVVAEMFGATLDDAVRQVVESPGLRQHLADA